MLANVKAKVKRLILSSQSKPIVYTADPNHEFAGKVALISGGSGGIGVDIAKALIEGGCTVVIAGTNENKLHDLRTDMNCDSIVMDYSRPDSFDDVLRTVVTNHGKLDIFVSSAGVHTENVDFWTMTPNEYDRVMNINLKGTFFACQAVGKYMRDANVQGSILLISSSRGSEPAWSPYGLSKWGINGMVLGLGKMLMPYGINVNAIAPGSTATPLIGVKEGDSIYTDENGMHRLVMPQEVASLAKLLVSDAGKMIDGEVIHIAAGRGTFDIR